MSETKKSKIARAISFLTLGFFLTNQIAFANPGAGIEMALKGELPAYLSIDIPAELGVVDTLYEAPSPANPQFILHIQDAHANYEAQMKIKQLLGYMNKKYGFKTIFVEGASEKLNADYLKLFPDKESNLKLCDELAKQGELTGAELFLMEQSTDDGRRKADGAKEGFSPSALRPPPSSSPAMQAYGIEKASLYKSNYEALKKVFGAAAEVERFFKGFDAKLDRAASKTFTPETRGLIADWKRFELGRREFMPFVQGLVKQAKKILEIDLESLFAQVSWPQITRLLVIQQMEKELDKAKGAEEQAALIKMLRGKGVSQELLTALENFGEGSISVGKSKREVSPRELLERLALEAGKKGFQFSDYPHFSLYAGRVILRSELDPKALFEEIERLFTRMLDVSAKEPRQQTLLALYRDGELLRKLLHLELNRAQWRQAVEARDRIAVPSLVARLKNAVQTAEGGGRRVEGVKGQDGGRRMADGEKPVFAPSTILHPISSVDVMPPEFAKTMDEIFSAGFKFYDFARQRENVFYQEMQTVMNERKITKAVLITGGFHTDGMSDLFRENAVSYGIVTPRLSEKSDEGLYQKIMLQNRQYPFEVSYLGKVFSGSQSFSAQISQDDPMAISNFVKSRVQAIRTKLNLGMGEAVAALNKFFDRIAPTDNLAPRLEYASANGRSEIRILPRTSEADISAENAVIGGKVAASIGPISSVITPTVAPAGRSENRSVGQMIWLAVLVFGLVAAADEIMRGSQIWLSSSRSYTLPAGKELSKWEAIKEAQGEALAKHLRTVEKEIKKRNAAAEEAIKDHWKKTENAKKQSDAEERQRLEDQLRKLQDERRAVNNRSEARAFSGGITAQIRIALEAMRREAERDSRNNSVSIVIMQNEQYRYVKPLLSSLLDQENSGVTAVSEATASRNATITISPKKFLAFLPRYLLDLESHPRRLLGESENTRSYYGTIAMEDKILAIAAQVVTQGNRKADERDSYVFQESVERDTPKVVISPIMGGYQLFVALGQRSLNAEVYEGKYKGGSPYVLGRIVRLLKAAGVARSEARGNDDRPLSVSVPKKFSRSFWIGLGIVGLIFVFVGVVSVMDKDFNNTETTSQTTVSAGHMAPLPLTEAGYQSVLKTNNPSEMLLFLRRLPKGSKATLGDASFYVENKISWAEVARGYGAPAAGSVGQEAPLTEKGYKSVLETSNPSGMLLFLRRLPDGSKASLGDASFYVENKTSWAEVARGYGAPAAGNRQERRSEARENALEQAQKMLEEYQKNEADFAAFQAGINWKNPYAGKVLQGRRDDLTRRQWFVAMRLEQLIPALTTLGGQAALIRQIQSIALSEAQTTTRRSEAREIKARVEGKELRVEGMLKSQVSTPKSEALSRSEVRKVLAIAVLLTGFMGVASWIGYVEYSKTDMVLNQKEYFRSRNLMNLEALLAALSAAESIAGNKYNPELDDSFWNVFLQRLNTGERFTQDQMVREWVDYLNGEVGTGKSRSEVRNLSAGQKIVIKAISFIAVTFGAGFLGSLAGNTAAVAATSVATVLWFKFVPRWLSSFGKDEELKATGEGLKAQGISGITDPAELAKIREIVKVIPGDNYEALGRVLEEVRFKQITDPAERMRVLEIAQAIGNFIKTQAPSDPAKRSEARIRRGSAAGARGNQPAADRLQPPVEAVKKVVEFFKMFPAGSAINLISLPVAEGVRELLVIVISREEELKKNVWVVTQHPAVHIWDAATGRKLKEVVLEGLEGTPQELHAFDNKLFVTGHGRTVAVDIPKPENPTVRSEVRGKQTTVDGRPSTVSGLQSHGTRSEVRRGWISAFLFVGLLGFGWLNYYLDQKEQEAFVLLDNITNGLTSLSELITEVNNFNDKVMAALSAAEDITGQTYNAELDYNFGITFFQRRNAEERFTKEQMIKEWEEYLNGEERKKRAKAQGIDLGTGKSPATSTTNRWSAGKRSEARVADNFDILMMPGVIAAEERMDVVLAGVNAAILLSEFETEREAAVHFLSDVMEHQFLFPEARVVAAIWLSKIPDKIPEMKEGALGFLSGAIANPNLSSMAWVMAAIRLSEIPDHAGAALEFLSKIIKKDDLSSVARVMAATRLSMFPNRQEGALQFLADVMNNQDLSFVARVMAAIRRSEFSDHAAALRFLEDVMIGQVPYDKLRLRPKAPSLAVRVMAAIRLSEVSDRKKDALKFLSKVMRKQVTFPTARVMAAIRLSEIPNHATAASQILSDALHRKPISEAQVMAAIRLNEFPHRQRAALNILRSLIRSEVRSPTLGVDRPGGGDQTAAGRLQLPAKALSLQSPATKTSAGRVVSGLQSNGTRSEVREIKARVEGKELRVEGMLKSQVSTPKSEALSRSEARGSTEGRWFSAKTVRRISLAFMAAAILGCGSVGEHTVPVNLTPQEVAISNSLGAAQVTVNEQGEVSVKLNGSNTSQSINDAFSAVEFYPDPYREPKRTATTSIEDIFEGKAFIPGQTQTVFVPVNIDAPGFRPRTGNVPAFYVIELANGSIVFQNSQARSAYAPPGGGYGYAYNASLTLPANAVSVKGIAWDQDGHLIVREWRIIVNPDGTLSLVPAEDQRPVRLAPAASNPAYFFTTENQTGTDRNNYSVLKLQNSSTGTIQELYSLQSPPYSYNNNLMDVSRDGRIVYFSATHQYNSPPDGWFKIQQLGDATKGTTISGGSPYSGNFLANGNISVTLSTNFLNGTQLGNVYTVDRNTFQSDLTGIRLLTQASAVLKEGYLIVPEKIEYSNTFNVTIYDASAGTDHLVKSEYGISYHASQAAGGTSGFGFFRTIDVHRTSAGQAILTASISAVGNQNANYSKTFIKNLITGAEFAFDGDAINVTYQGDVATYTLYANGITRTINVDLTTLPPPSSRSEARNQTKADRQPTTADVLSSQSPATKTSAGRVVSGLKADVRDEARGDQTRPDQAILYPADSKVFWQGRTYTITRSSFGEFEGRKYPKYILRSVDEPSATKTVMAIKPDTVILASGKVLQASPATDNGKPVSKGGQQESIDYLRGDANGSSDDRYAGKLETMDTINNFLRAHWHMTRIPLAFMAAAIFGLVSAGVGPASVQEAHAQPSAVSDRVSLNPSNPVQPNLLGSPEVYSLAKENLTFITSGGSEAVTTGPDDSLVMPLNTAKIQGVSGGFDFAGIRFYAGQQIMLQAGSGQSTNFGVRVGNVWGQRLNYYLEVKDPGGNAVQFNLGNLLENTRYTFSILHDPLYQKNLRSISETILGAEDLQGPSAVSSGATGKATVEVFTRPATLEVSGWRPFSVPVDLYQGADLTTVTGRAGFGAKADVAIDPFSGNIVISIPDLDQGSGDYAFGGIGFRVPIDLRGNGLPVPVVSTAGTTLLIEVQDNHGVKGWFPLKGIPAEGPGGVMISREALTAQGLDTRSIKFLIFTVRVKDGGHEGVITVPLKGNNPNYSFMTENRVGADRNNNVALILLSKGTPQELFLLPSPYEYTMAGVSPDEKLVYFGGINRFNSPVTGGLVIQQIKDATRRVMLPGVPVSVEFLPDGNISVTMREHVYRVDGRTLSILPSRSEVREIKARVEGKELRVEGMLKSQVSTPKSEALSRSEARGDQPLALSPDRRPGGTTAARQPTAAKALSPPGETRSEMRKDQSVVGSLERVKVVVAAVRGLGPKITEGVKARIGFRPEDLKRLEDALEGTGIKAETLAIVLVAVLAGGITAPEVTAEQMEALQMIAKAQATPLPVQVQQVRGILGVKDEEGLLFRFMAPGTAIGEANLVALANTKQHMVIVWMADAKKMAAFKSQAATKEAALLKKSFAKDLAIQDRFNMVVVDEEDPMAGLNPIIDQKKARMPAISHGLLRYVFMGDLDSLNRLGDAAQALMIDQPVGKDEVEEIVVLSLGAGVSQEILKVQEATEIDDAVARMLDKKGTKGFYSFKSDVLNAMLAIALRALQVIAAAA